MKLRLQENRKAELLIYEDIGQDFFTGGITAKSFSQQLKELGQIDEINVRINSVGGNSWDAMAIYNQLTRHPATVSVDIDGVAASAASLIAMAADPGQLRMAANADLMIHRSWAIEQGTVADMQRIQKRLADLDEKQVDILATRATCSRDDLKAMLAAETWFTAAEAKQVGLIDEITKPMKIAAQAFGLGKFANVPAHVAAKYNHKGATLMSTTRTKARLSAAVAAAVEPLKAQHAAEMESIKAKHAADLDALKAIGPNASELVAAERDRVHELHVLAQNAGFVDAATVDRWITKQLTVTDAKAEIGELAIKHNKLAPNDNGQTDASTKERAAEMAACAEFQEHASIHASLGMDEEKWVARRAKELLAQAQK